LSLDAEAASHLTLHEAGSPLEALVGVLGVHGLVVTVRVFAALEKAFDDGAELGVGVAGVVNMRLGLLDVSRDRNHRRGDLTQLPLRSISRARQ
jgi:hypothetical protein